MLGIIISLVFLKLVKFFMCVKLVIFNVCVKLSINTNGSFFFTNVGAMIPSVHICNETL